MKSNMSSLTKKLLFFLVFSILSNFSTSNETMVQNCINNVRGLFYSDDTHTNFTFAMAALSLRSLNLHFVSREAHELVDHFQSFDGVIENIGDENITSKHKEVINYVQSLADFIANNGLSHSHSGASSMAQRAEINVIKKNDLLGYFQSFVTHFGKSDYYGMAESIKTITLSPMNFCDLISKYEFMSLKRVNKFECIHALSIMLNVKGPTALNDFMGMSGSEALELSYLNHTYLDFNVENPNFNFVLNNVSLESSSSSSYVESNESLSREYRQKLVNIMIKYFSYLLTVSTQIGILHSQLNYPQSKPVPDGDSLFLTVVEYCQNNASLNRS